MIIIMIIADRDINDMTILTVGSFVNIDFFFNIVFTSTVII